MKTLIVYELIPEDTQFFLVDSNDADINAVLALAHGYFLNYDCPDDVQEALEALNLMLGDRTDDDLAQAVNIGVDQRLVGILKGCKVEKDKPFKFDGELTVIHTGFAL